MGWLGQSVGKITGSEDTKVVKEQGAGWPSTCVTETQQEETVDQEQKSSMSGRKTNRQQSLSGTRVGG